MAREDLIPLNQRTKEEQKKIASAGGVASGAARRRKRSLREAADLYLSLPPADRRSWNKLARKGLAPDEIDNQMAMVVGLTEQAIRGDARAARVIVDLLGDAAGEDKKPSAAGDKLLSAVPVQGGEGGVTDHRALSHRDAAKQHPILSIDGLSEELERIPEPVEPLTNEDLEEILK